MHNPEETRKNRNRLRCQDGSRWRRDERFRRGTRRALSYLGLEGCGRTDGLPLRHKDTKGRKGWKSMRPLAWSGFVSSCLCGLVQFFRILLIPCESLFRSARNLRILSIAIFVLAVSVAHLSAQEGPPPD